MMGRGFAEMPERHGLECLDASGADWLTVDANHGRAAVEALRRNPGIRRYAMDLFDCADILGPGDIFQTGTDWTGTKGDRQASHAWLAAWSKKCAALSILTDGGHGLFLGTADFDPIWLGPLLIEPVVDATGAGDSFRAGLIHALSEGHALPQSVPFAMACGAIACTALGAGGAVLSSEGVHAVIEANGDRVSEIAAKLHKVDWNW